MKPNFIEMIIRCQGGLYIKELISGDKGRTMPSVAEISGIPAKCVKIDVMDVEMGGL
jgi:tRNA pseudouridine synthase 10